MQKTAAALVVVAFLTLPAVAFAAGSSTPQELQITGSAVFEGQDVPVHATVSTGQDGIQLSSTKTDGATPVTITFYLAPKPKPVVVATPAPASSGQAAAVQSSQNIQDSIAGFSPQAAEVTEPVFTLIDAGREKAAEIVNNQLDKTKAVLGTSTALSIGTAKDATQNPGGTFWRILQTLYLYILTILGFIINSAVVFYPLLMIAILYAIWKLFKRFRRPSY